MKQQTHAIHGKALAVLLACCFTLAARAQDHPRALAPEPAMTVAPVSMDASVEALASLDLTGLSAAWWKTMRRDLMRSLGASEKTARMRSLQTAIFLATHYRDEARLSRVSGRLYEIYRLDADEQHRLLALAALHAIGHEDTMRHLAQDVRLERSTRVRRLTQAAVADYFGAHDR